MIDLNNILNRIEDDYLEAKSAKGGFPDSFWESYSAFANTDGGVILLGVEENPDHTLNVKEGLKDVEKMKTEFWKLVNNRQKISHNIVTNRMVYSSRLDGKDILVVEVPRADRMARPVYKGLDPRNGSFRRWGSGDHLCTLEEVGAMLRDATSITLDSKVLKGVKMDAFCQDTINAYRQNFKAVNYGHLWNSLEDELFLRRIGAIGVGDDGKYYPTAAGLLMFGYEYEIVREFPNYFLDYQEDRVMIGATRWKDRVVSSSGDWSGNIFDFVFKILPKLQADLKIPFVLRGNQRIDDTPVHKLLREALVNALSNADYYGRQGIVIAKNKDGFSFSNPGRLRISKQEAIGGGISDPRNGIILKMFSLIRFGERAGSGLNSILHIWNKVYHTDAYIAEKIGEVDRTILSLPFDGNAQDVDAMLKLYDDFDNLSFSEDQKKEDSDSKKPIEALSTIRQKIVDKLSTNPDIVDKLSINDDFVDKMASIIDFLSTHPHSTSEQVALLTQKSVSRAKNYLKALVELEMIVLEGGNKNRTYSRREI